MRSFIKKTLIYILSTIKSFIKILKKIKNFLYLYLIQEPIDSVLENKARSNQLTPFERHINDQSESSYNYFKKFFLNAVFLDTKKIQIFSIKKAVENQNNSSKKQFYLEFGVFTGRSINILSKHTKKIYGFDSFAGLNEDWIGTSLLKGTFDTLGKMPKVNKNVELIKGVIQHTLPNFIHENLKNNCEIAFLHIDTDTYETAKYILENTKKYMAKNAIILFDEFYNFMGWQVGEFKALSETYNNEDFEYIAFSIDGAQVCIQLKK